MEDIAERFDQLYQEAALAAELLLSVGGFPVFGLKPGESLWRL